MQQRSQETVQRILGAASKLLCKRPIEEITTHLIARQARLSIGALYRFFPDKQAIVDAIAIRHVQDFQSALERILVERPPESPTVFFEAVIDTYIDLLDARPDFRAIALGHHISAETRRRQTDPDAPGSSVLKRFMLEVVGMRGSAELDMRLKIAIETGERLIAYAYEQPDQVRRQSVIGEMKRLLAGYLFATT